MDKETTSHGTSRRRFLSISAVLSGGALAAACGGTLSPTAAPKAAEPTKSAAAAEPTKPAAAAPTTAPAAAPTTAPTAAPAAATKPAAAPAATAAPAAAAGGKTVPRNRTLVMVRGGSQGKYANHDLWNPYAIGADIQNNLNIMYEPLAFYSAFADQETMWLAESYKYSPDYTQLTIKTRSGIKWSDGKPFSAEDVAYTLTKLIELGPKVKWGKDVQEVVKDAKASDDSTTVINFQRPAPRFFYHMLSYKYDIGLHIVPKHIFDGQDWTSFKHWDPTGKPDWPITTSAWKAVSAAPTEKVWDRRASWWGAGVVGNGYGQLPKVERLILLPDTGEQQLVQGLVSNAVDFSTGLQVDSFQTVFKANPKVVTHTGQQLPYGYVDWWPTSLYVNTTRAPYDNPDFRWALSYLIDRDQLVKVGWGGSSKPNPLPMPDPEAYKGLRPYIDAAKSLLEKYPTNEFNPKKGQDLLAKLGWKKGGDGLYTDPKGEKFTLEILSFFDFPSVGPVLAELLKRQGINATYSQPPDFFDRFGKGDYNAAIFGHGGSIKEPFETLRLYQSASKNVPGGHLVNLSLWENAEYDKIVDEVYVTPPTDQKKVTELFLKAMEIWLPQLPDVQLMQFYHRLPMNLTYWTGYPDQKDPYVNAAFFHSTCTLVLHKLMSTQ